MYDRERQKFVYLEPVPIPEAADEPLKEVPKELAQPDLLHQEYNNVNLIVSNARGTLVPEAFFDQDSKYSYFNLNFQHASGETIKENFINQLRAYLVWSVPSTLLDSFAANIKAPQHIYHAGTLFLENTLIQYQRNRNNLIVTDLEASLARIAVIKNGNLHFFNMFSYSNDVDLLYYLMYVSDKLEIKPDADSYVFTGEIYRNSELYQLLDRYLGNISFGQRPETLEYSHQFNQISAHNYYTLVGIGLCE